MRNKKDEMIEIELQKLREYIESNPMELHELQTRIMGITGEEMDFEAYNGVLYVRCKAKVECIDVNIEITR